MITLKVGNIFTDVEGDLPQAKYRLLEKRLSFRPDGYFFHPLYNRLIRNKNGEVVGRMWDGWKKQCWRNKRRTYFPTGLMSLAYQFFQEENIPVQVVDLSEKPIKEIDYGISDEYELRDYQQDAVYKACETTRGIIQIPTGGGKTVLGAGIIKELGVSPFLFFVTSIDLLMQSKEAIENILRKNGSNLTVGQIGGGEVSFGDINVMTIQTTVRALGKEWKKCKFDNEDTDDKTDIQNNKKDILDLIQSAKGSICDEVQHWRASTCQLVARELHSAYYTFGMSATPFRDDGDDMMIQACFGKIICQISPSELIRRGYLVRPSIKMLHLRQSKSIFKQWQSIYKDQVVENDVYNRLLASIANKFAKSGRLVLGLTQQVQHGKDLASMIDGSTFLSGSSPKKKRQEGIRKLRNREISSIVSTTIFDEGIDVRPLDTLILAGQGKSRVRAMQRVGRVMRPYTDENGNKKTKASVIDVCLHQKYLEDHAKARMKMYKMEPEFEVEDMEIDL